MQNIKFDFYINSALSGVSDPSLKIIILQPAVLSLAIKIKGIKMIPSQQYISHYKEIIWFLFYFCLYIYFNLIIPHEVLCFTYNWRILNKVPSLAYNITTIVGLVAVAI